jgi:SAM-dependent methyltransferase
VRPDLWWPDDGADQWLNKSDGELALFLLATQGASRRHRALEIGVWKAGWSTVLLMNNPSVQVTGLDPYPAAAKTRELAISRIRRLGLFERFSLHDEWNEIPSGLKFDLIHIDGKHTEPQVQEDLSQSASRLREDGVIVVDDFRHPYFPGVASALFKFVWDTDMRIFLTSSSKAYLARGDHAANLFDKLIENRDDFEHCELFRNHDELSQNSRYVQETSVRGQPVLLAVSK